MRKIIMFFVVILSILGLFSCGKDEEPKEEVKLSEIILTDKLGNVIVEDRVDVGISYLHQNIYVKAIYSDESTKDVTKLSNFSKVDTSKVGTKECEVSFQHMKTTYKVIVEGVEAKRLDLNLSDVKLLYQIGEVFSKDGLIVKKYYVNGTFSVVEDYTITITDSENQYHSLNVAFRSVGNYDVRISSDTLVNHFQISVYNRQLLTDNLSMDSLRSEVDLKEDGSCILKENQKILSLNNIHLTNAGLETKYETKADGNEILEFYETFLFHSRLLLDTENGLKLNIEKDIDLAVFISGERKSTLVFKNETSILNPIGNPKDGVRLYYIHLTKGTYEILSSEGTIYLYGIQYHLSDEVVYHSMTLDTSNVKIKYELNGYFDKKNLIVKVTDENMIETIIDPSLCLFELRLNSKVKATLDEIGVYTVTVSYGGVKASYTIIVEDYVAPIEYQSIEVDDRATKKTYYVGDSFDKSKVIVRAKDNRGVGTTLSVAVCQFTIKRGNEIVSSFNEAGTYTIVVSYRTSTKTLMDEYTVVVMDKYKALFVDSSAARLNYHVGDTLDLTGVVVKLVNSSNQQMDIDVFDCFKKLTLDGVEKTSLDEAGTYQVVLSYVKDGQTVMGSYSITVL